MMKRIKRLVPCDTYASVHVDMRSVPNKKSRPAVIRLEHVPLLAVGCDPGDEYDDIEPVMIYDNYMDLCKEDSSYKGMVPRSASDMTVRRYLEYVTGFSRKVLNSIAILRDPETTKAYREYADLQADMDIINQRYLNEYAEAEKPVTPKKTKSK